MNSVVLRTEVDKLRSLASTWWLLGIMAVVSLARAVSGCGKPRKGRSRASPTS
jgi:ABC-2 type transport system permease protein